LQEDKKEIYCREFSEDEPEILKSISRETFANVLKPRMLSGHYQGRFLSLISHLLSPLNILEIGTYTGYSAICLSEGLKEGGKVTTIEANEELQKTILSNFKYAGVENKINLIIGPALDKIKELNIKFDLVFIDADKINYINYYNLIFPKVSIGGVILSDNVLWDSKVFDLSQNDETTLQIRKFNSILKLDNRTQKIMLPIRDGLFISRKIKE
jgi:caffeoyl-CoA O-methyltransferase